MTYIFNIILCVICLIHLYFWLPVLVKLLKHVKPIIFENYNERKTKHLFLLKKVVKRLIQNSGIAEKSIDEEKNLLLRALKKKTLSLRDQRIPYH